MNRAAARLLALATVLALSAAACSGSSAPATPTPAIMRTGALYFGTDLGVMRLALDGTAPAVLIPRPDPPATSLIDPAVSPDGARLAFVRRPPAKVVGGVRDISYDLWLASADGTAPRELVAHVGINERFVHPQWRDDQNLSVVVQRQADPSDVKTTTFVLEEVDVPTGARTTIQSDVAGFDSSRTSAAFAYSVATRSPYAGYVYLLSTPGSPPLPLLTPAEPLGFASSPRISPDGQSVAFAAFDRAAFINATHETAPPVQIFITPVSGGARRLVAEVEAETPPGIAWSGDGDYLYVITAEAIHEVSVATGELRSLVEGLNFAGELSWHSS